MFFFFTVSKRNMISLNPFFLLFYYRRKWLDKNKPLCDDIYLFEHIKEVSIYLLDCVIVPRISCISMGECNTILSAYTSYRHLG